MINHLLSNTTAKAFNALVSQIEELSVKLSLEYIFYGSIGLVALILVIALLRVGATYEAKLIKRVRKLNAYLSKKQYIDDNNLVEFNDKMKQLPKTARHYWQEYMLYRDRPSKYLNCDSCIDIPTRVSSYKSAIKVTRIFVTIVAALSFILCLGNYYSLTGYSAYLVFFQALLVPILIYAVGMLVVAFLSARHTAVMSDLYHEFQQFEKNLDIACKTLPEVIDYEILFTKKEIKENIPALQEYLEKSAEQEKKRKEDEAMVAMVGENYDFEELGVDSSLLLERAMKESEKYLNVKRNFSERIRAKEQEKVNFQKNFDEVTKDFERKAQASREIINTLSDQINQTTVKIEANYLKKKLNEEQARYQQYEKDYDLANTRFQKEQQDIQYEIDKFNEEIKRRKEQATENMLAEGKTYVNKIYGQVTETVLKQNGPILDETQATINKMKEEVAQLNSLLQDKDNIIAEKEKAVDVVRQELNLRLAEIEATKSMKEYIASEEFRQRLAMSKRELKNASKEDREAFKHTKKKMKRPVEATFDGGFESQGNVQVVSLPDQNAGVSVVKLPEDTGNVSVVKLPDENPAPSFNTEQVLANVRAAAEETRDELEVLGDSIAEENRKLEEDSKDLNNQISAAKGKGNLKDRMSKLNAKSQKTFDDEKATKAAKTTTTTKKAPTFNVPKIKK